MASFKSSSPLALMLFLVGCGEMATGPSIGVSPSAAANGDGIRLPSALGSMSATAITTVGEILADPDAFLRQEVQLQGSLNAELGGGEFMFTDGTGQIPADFSAAGSTPPLNTKIRVFGKVASGGATFAARIDVASWDSLTSFNCDTLEDARARTSDPGFELGNIVGLFLTYEGVPSGNKILEIDWDEGNPKSAVQTLELGPGEPDGNGLFRLEGVVTHEYENVNSSQTKKVRATLTIEGLKGQCARVRDVKVSPGSGPDSAAGGSLRVIVDNPVFSESQFEVRATVQNLVSAPIEVALVYLTPTDSSLDPGKLPPECEVFDNDLVGCRIGEIPPGEGLSKVITYTAPQTSNTRQISGKVALVVGEFAPIASYSTTVEPLR
ncbi:MAG: hypothetical protein ACRD1X_08435 [Vicinamibacteria bacterium]